MRLFAYVGGITEVGWGKAPDTLNLSNATVRSAVVATSVRVTEEGGHRDYMREVARRCDQIALMSYDTGCPTKEAYVDILAQIVPAMARVCSGTSCRFLMGVPAYQEMSAQHNPRVENVETALAGIRRGILATPDTSSFQGVAVYAHWTASEEDWQAYDRLWGP